LKSFHKAIIALGRLFYSCQAPEDGMGADIFVDRLDETIKPIGANDTIFVFGDIIGGSPLTNALNELAKKGLLPHVTAFGGVNLPMVLTAAMESDLDDETLIQEIQDEGKEAIRLVELDFDDEDEEEDL
jgi:PTS system N-acetylgalactosamine-specific IIA component